MKKLLILFLALMSLSLQAAQSFRSESVLATGHWVKISVAQSGVYRLTYSDLQAAGLSNPAQVRIYGYGGRMLPQSFLSTFYDDLTPVAFAMYKGDDGVFGPGDFILFWAEANIGWSWNSTYSQFEHTRNTYSDLGYYFLSDDAGEQHLLSTRSAPEGQPQQTVDTYLSRALHERDSMNLLDRSGKAGGGREFYGEEFHSNAPSRTFRLSLPDVLTDQPLYYTVAAAGYSSATSSFTITINGATQAGAINCTAVSSNDFYTMATTGTRRGNCAAVAGDQTVQLRYNINATGALGNLNYIELTATSRLRLSADAVPFRTNIGLKQNQLLQYRLQNANAATEIWNITTPGQYYRPATQLQGDVLSFVESNREAMQEYVAVRPSGAFPTPTIVGAINNQNLHGLSNIDYVIITPAAFYGEALRLAAVHQQYSKVEDNGSYRPVTTAVVTDQQVYNEFSSGTPDATAYRRLMKMLFDRAGGIQSSTRPRWLLLFGDGSFDNRHLLPLSGNHCLLTYQAANSTVETKAYATDDYFGFLEDSEGDISKETASTMEIGVGRLPVYDITSAAAMVDKISTYLANKSYGRWKNQIVFLADDGDNGLHIQTAEYGAEKVRLKNPDFVVNKIYLDAYPQEKDASGERYPLAKNRLYNLLNNGLLYLNYSGHGGATNITNEGMMSIKDIQGMTNTNLGLWMLATCSFAHFDGNTTSSAEEAVLNSHGGAIGVFSADRTVYADRNTELNTYFCDTLFGHRDVWHYDMTIGDAARIAKNQMSTKRDENRMAYVLLGDPAIRLRYPTELQVVTTTAFDTLHALEVQQIEGELRDADNQLADWFNGQVDVTIYDKIQQITTRDNDAPEGDKKLLTYLDYPNKIFNSTTTVSDGHFSLSFMAPKDIRYNYGAGRIVYYAWDEDNEAEAVGHDHSLTIGGSSIVAIQDTVGPEMRLYLNTPEWLDGGTTYATPRFFAELQDPHGINTVGAGIGHDLLLIVDEKVSETYSLNDYFIADPGTYTSGRVSYRMNNLSDGPHSLSFRAWDLLNNSSTGTLRFSVDHALSPAICRVMTYPNPVPAGSDVHLDIHYDQPDAVILSEVYLYDIQGHLIWKQEQGNPDKLTLPLGQLHLHPGVYFHRVRIHTEGSRYADATGKIIITK